MKNRTVTGAIVALIFVLIVICSLKVHYLFFDALVLLLMIVGAFELRRAIKQRLGNPVMFLVIYICCFGYAGFYILNNIGERDPIWGTAVYLMIIAVAVLYNFLYHYILKRVYQKNNAATTANCDKPATIDDCDKPATIDDCDKPATIDDCDKPATAINDCDKPEVDKACLDGADSLSTDGSVQQKNISSACSDDKNNNAVADVTQPIVTNPYATALCLLYPPVFLVLMLSLNYLAAPFRASAIILLFTVSPFTDVFAYLVGSTLRGKKLCPKISPNKTISGAIGGLFGGIIGGALLMIFASQSAFSWLEIGGRFVSNKTAFIINCLVLGVLGSAFTQLGDILASYVKRKCGIKDFGHILPGHGGIMDRIDGMILNASFIFAYMYILSI